MATPNPMRSSTGSFSSGDKSPEHTTMRECHVALVDLLKPSIGSLGDALFARGLIPQDVKEILRMNITPADKAREVVDCVTSQVKHNSSVYHEFMSILREQGQWTYLIVEKLTSCYESQTATPEFSASLTSKESQNKLQFEFTVPQDVPQEMLRVLESVQVSILMEDQNKSRRTLMETQLSVGGNNSSAQQGTPSTAGPQIEWCDEPNIAHCATGRRDVLNIISKVATSHPEVVPRRSRGPLTEEERRKLEEQGVHEDYCHSDLSIMTARQRLDKDNNVVETIRGEHITCESVKGRITDLMNTTDKEGVMLHYIGPGKKRTGDWCFSDGFISFREIMGLYTPHFRGRVLTIYSDCSYSGSWVREAMTFMDEQGVGPCGHVAKEKEILVKVYTSCLVNEIPAELAFSVHCIQNDKNRGFISYRIDLYTDKIHGDQHPSGIDFTVCRCKNKIDQPCTMAPGSTWQKWSAQQRTMIVNGEDKGRPAWHYLLLVDDEETIRIFKDKTRGENVGKHTININDFGKILKSGWGQDPTNVEQQWVEDHYYVNYNYEPSSHTAD